MEIWEWCSQSGGWTRWFSVERGSTSTLHLILKKLPLDFQHRIKEKYCSYLKMLLKHTSPYQWSIFTFFLYINPRHLLPQICNAEADARIQLPLSKPDTNEVCKNLQKLTWFLGFFLQNVVIFQKEWVVLMHNDFVSMVLKWINKDF